MIQVRHIVCCVDFSDFSRRALDHAVAVATWYEARLTVMHAYNIPLATLASAPFLSPVPADAVALAPADRESLQRQLEALLPQGAAAGISVEYRIVEGDVATAILRAAESADLLVVGTHGRSGFA
ncbi:MAG TPA: universal stress protein, partial [Methylomirabilota bacterium]|nr:universal stress protein [Methylomirabilota bacterium]